MQALIWLFLFVPMDRDGPATYAQMDSEEECSAFVEVSQAVAKVVGVEGDFYCIPARKIGQ